MQQPNGLFKNYADGFNGSTNSSSGNFDDASSSALLAATVYHLALLTGNKTFIPQAERTRAALFARNGTSAPSPSPSLSSTSSSPHPSSSSSPFSRTPHFTPDGWLEPVVDPLNVASEGSTSPEGQAFALMLHAAWRDWTAVIGNSPWTSSAAHPTPPSVPLIWGGCGHGGAGLVLAVVVAIVVRTIGDLFV